MKPSSNPTLGRGAIARLSTTDVKDGTVMTVPGIAKKGLGLLLLVMVSAAYTWRAAAVHGPDFVLIPAAIGLFGGFVLALVTTFMPAWAPVTAPIYAVCKGLGIGAISFMVNAQYHGIPMQAAVATLGISGVCFGLFATGRIDVSESFAEKVAIGMIGLLVVYLLQFLLVLAGVPLGSTMNRGVFGFAINALSIGLAIGCLFIDFAEIENARSQKLSAKSEWYFAFSVLVTILWMYISMLRMLRRLRR